MQFKCQGDSPLSLDLLRLSIPLVRGVFPGRQYFALVSPVGEPQVEDPTEIDNVDGDYFLPFATRCKNSIFQAHDGVYVSRGVFFGVNVSHTSRNLGRCIGNLQRTPSIHLPVLCVPRSLQEISCKLLESVSFCFIG